MKKILNVSFLRKTALILVMTGAVVSLILTFIAGHKNNAFILTFIFAVWVLSPYTAFLMSDVISKSWSVLCRSTLYCLMVVLTLGSLLLYSGILRLHGVKPAFVFIIVPLISWILLIIIIPLNERLSRKMPDKNS